MTEKEELVRAIAERPEDTELRLVFADWLEETGNDPNRATFIRLQCAAAGKPKWAPEWQEHRRFRDRHPASEVEPPLPAGMDWPPYAFERGFAAKLRVRLPEALVAQAESVFARSPITHIELDAREPSFPLQALLDRPELRRVRALTFTLGGFDVDHVQQLDECPNLVRLEKLAFRHGGITLPGLRALLHSRLSQRLTKLNLSNDFGTADGPLLAQIFADAPQLPNLRTLKLVRDCIADVRALLRPFPGLREVLLDGNPLDRDAAPTLARLDLQALDLSHTGLRLGGLRALAEGLSNTACIRLARNELGPKAAPIIAGARGWQNLECLDLDQNRFGSDGVKAILDSPSLAHVRRGQISDLEQLPPELRERALRWSQGR